MLALMLGSLLLGSLATGCGSTGAPITLSDSFLRQWAYTNTESRFNAVLCSRRGGKSEGAVRRAAKLITTKVGARVLYVTLIRHNSQKLFFEPLKAFLQVKGWAFDSDKSHLTITLPNGSYVECRGCLDMDDVDKVARGDKWDLVIVDEAQSFRDEVIRAFWDAILPSLGDRRGAFDLLGTPPPAGPVGFFHEAFTEGLFTRFHWTLFDNPFFPQDEIKTLCDARGLTPDHPIYKREFLGEFVVDVDSLVYEYQVERNDLPPGFVPEPGTEQWRFSMGIDLGFQDRDAIVVLGWRRDDGAHKLHECYSWQQNHQDVDQLAEVVKAAYTKFKPGYIVGDTGGHGAVKVLKTLESRLGGVRIAAKPSSLLDSIGVMNDDLRTGRLLLDPRGPIAHDAKLVTWAPGKIKQEVSDAYHSDVTEACRYAHWGARHFKGKEPPPPKSLDQRRAEHSAWKRRVQADPFNPSNYRRPV